MRYTLILVPETAQGCVRKLQVRLTWLRAAAGLAVGLLVVSGVVLRDYVRMRRDLIDLRLHAHPARSSAGRGEPTSFTNYPRATGGCSHLVPGAAFTFSWQATTWRRRT